MSKWDALDLTAIITKILEDVHLNNPAGHHLGRPYVSAYHIAIEIETRHPQLFAEIGKPVGGRGTGQHDSLAQYVSNELSKRVKAAGQSAPDDSIEPDFPIEGVFMSNERISAMVFQKPDGTEIRSSLAGTPFDIALYRTRSAD